MSKYTTELRFICETEAGLTESVGFSEVENVIAEALPKIFDFDFPIFDEDYRETLETKIIRHYYTREIGLETYGLWKLKLATKLNEIMPYYNKLYESELYKYNPLYDVNLITSNTGKKTGESAQSDSRTNERTGNDISKNSEENSEAQSNSTTSKGSRSIENKGLETNAGSSESIGSKDNLAVDAYSDTPQGTLLNVMNEAYLTNARKVTDTGGTTERGNTTGVSNSESTQSEDNDQSVSESRSRVNSRNADRTNAYNENSRNTGTAIANNNTTENYVTHVMGKSAGTNYARMIKDFRDNLLNIDMDIIRELSDLFMLIW